MPRIDCFDIIKNNPELVSEFISITEDMPEVEQRKQAIQIVNKLLEASNESLNKVKRKVGQKPQKYNSGVSQDAIDEIIKKYSQPEQKETPQAESNPALRDVESVAKALEGKDINPILDSQRNKSGDEITYLPNESIIDKIKKAKVGDEITLDIAVDKYLYGHDSKQFPSIQHDNGFSPKGVREIKEPIKISIEKIENPFIEAIDGNHRIVQARFNKDKTIPAKLKITKQIKEQADNFNLQKSISEAYHKAKADGSNPELVKAVESLLSNEQTQTQPTVSASGLLKYKKKSIAERFSKGLDATSVMEGGEIYPDDVTQRAAWRSMGKKEFEGLLSGNEIGGDAKKGGYFGDNPAIASAQKGEGKYLVEFGGKKVEGETTVGKVSLKDITGVWKYENDKWNKLDKEAVESLLSKEQTSQTKNDFQYVIDKANKAGGGVKNSGTKKINLSDRETAILNKTIEKLEAKAVANNGASFDPIETINIQYETINGKEQKINTYTVDGYSIKYRRGRNSFIEITTPQGDLLIVSKQYGKTEIAYLGKSEPIISKEQTPPALRDVESTAKALEGVDKNAWGSDKGLTENFYTTDVDGYAIKKPITNPSSVTIDGVDFHIAKVDGDWKVIEKKSGLEISTGKTSNTKSAAIEDATMRLAQNGGAENLPTLIDRAIQGFKDRNAKAVESLSKEQTPSARDVESTAKEQMSDNDLQGLVGRDVFKQIQKSEEQLGEGVVDRNRMIETAKQIQKADKKDKLLPEHIFEALQYETGFPDNWQDLRNAIKKGGIDVNSEAVQRQIEVGVKLPKDIVEEFKKSERYKNANPELVKAVESLLSNEQTPQAGSGDVGGEQPLKETSNEGKVNLSTSAPKQSITKKAFTALTTMLKKAFPKVEFIGEKEAREIMGGSDKPSYQITMPDGSKKEVQPINDDVINGFYSPLEKIISETKFDKLPAKQWIDKFAKGEEAKWTGLTDWLNQQQGSVSKADIQQYLKDNRISFVEVVKGGIGNMSKADAKKVFEDNGYDVITDRNGDTYIEKNEEVFDYNDMSELEQNAFDILTSNNLDRVNTANDTKFGNRPELQLEGEKENYKEVLVTLPKDALTDTERDRYGELAKKEVFDGVDSFSDAERKEYSRLDKKSKQSREAGFSSSHFDEPNILVHLRMNTRTDSEGNKVLFLEEVQSDWGQSGKKEGFKEPSFEWDTQLGKDAVVVLKKMNETAGFSDWKGLATAMAKSNDILNDFQVPYDNKDLMLKWHKAVNQERKTPQAPFVTDTNAWTKLALKVALKEAVKQGVDKLAWTTGEQQVGRYEDDFRKQVDKIETESKKAYGSVYVIAYKNGNVVFENDMPLEGKTNIGGREVDLEDVVGKEIANKIRTGEQKQNFEGKDLTIGGKGMEDFYGKPSDAIRSKNFTIKKEGELFAVTDENGKTIRTFKQENEAIKFKENYGLGIVGNVAKSLTKQEVGTVEIENGSNRQAKYIGESPTLEDLEKVKAVAIKGGSDIYISPITGDKQMFPVNRTANSTPLVNAIREVRNGKDVITAMKENGVDPELFGGKWEEQSKSSTQHSIDITPELKAQVEQGLPLFMRTAKGEVFGFQQGSKIFIDPSLINADTPIHEVVGHYGMNIIDAMAKGGDEKAQAIIAKGFSLLQAPEGKAVLDEIKANPAYSNLSLMEKKMEALATIIGREGANMFTEGTRKNTFASKVKDFIKSFYDYIRTKVPTLKDKTIKQIVAMDNKEFIRAIVGDAFRGEIVQQNNESLSDDIRFSNDYESSPQFKKWKGNNRLVSGDEVQDVKTGEPIVVKGYHGTTNEFYEFDSSVKGNVEGHLGKVNYFTSDEQDASSNYQADGADITSRVSRRSEYLEDYLYDEFGIVARQSPPVKVSELDYKKISDEFNIPISDLKKQKSSELYKYIAEKELKGDTEKVLDLYIKLNNPVVLGSGATWVETLNISDKDLEQAAQEIADENGVTIEEAKEDYEWDIRDRAIENTGYENVVLDALSDALESNGYDGQLASNILGDNIYDAEINLNDLEKRMRKAELYDNNEGEMAGSQVISDFFKNLGFDGIILTDVSDRFKNMGLGSTTSHIHVFDEFKNQIKLADGTNTTFNPNTNDIRFQASPKTDLQEAERKLKEAWGKYLSNGISFDGMAEAEKERQLIVALLGYLKAKGIDIAKGIGNEVRDFIKNKFSGVTDEMIDVAQGRMLTDYQKLYDTHMTPKNKEILDGMVSQVKSGEMSFEDFINTIDGIVPNERIKNVFISYVNEQIDPLDGYVAVDEEIEESPESPKAETSKEEERAFIGGLLARPINRKNFPNIVGDNKTDDDVLKRITAVTQEDVQDRKVMVDTSYVRVALENIKEIALQNANALYMQFGEDWQNKVMDYLSDYLNAANPAQAIGILNVISTDVQQKIEKSQSPTERTKLFKLQDKADELSILFASQASLGINARKILRQFAQGGNMSKLVLDKILTEDTMQTIEEINRIAASKPTNEELNNATLPVQVPQTPKSRIQKIKQNVKAALSSKQKNKPKITEKEINELGRRAEEERKRQGVQTKMSRQQIAQMLKEEAKKC